MHSYIFLRQQGIGNVYRRGHHVQVYVVIQGCREGVHRGAGSQEGRVSVLQQGSGGLCYGLFGCNALPELEFRAFFAGERSASARTSVDAYKLLLLFQTSQVAAYGRLADTEIVGQVVDLYLSVLVHPFQYAALS